MRLRVGALLALPFVIVIVAVRWSVPAWGDRIARRVVTLTAVLHVPPRARRSEPAPVGPAPQTDPVPSDAGVGDGGGRAGAGKGRTVESSAAPPPSSVHVPAPMIQRAIDDQGNHIRAKTVRGPDGSPRGIRLSGVSGLGLGLRDGDVVVAIEGQPTLDEDAATDAALSAIARGSSVLHATLKRGDQPFALVADLPLEPVQPPAGKAR